MRKDESTAVKHQEDLFESLPVYKLPEVGAPQNSGGNVSMKVLNLALQALSYRIFLLVAMIMNFLIFGYAVYQFSWGSLAAGAVFAGANWLLLKIFQGE